MRISDWSSDVCSSDLPDPASRGGASSIAVTVPPSLTPAFSTTILARPTSRTTPARPVSPIWMRCMASFLWLSCIKSVFSFAPAAGASVILLQPGKDRQAFLLQPLSIIKRRKITETRIRQDRHDPFTRSQLPRKLHCAGNVDARGKAKAQSLLRQKIAHLFQPFLIGNAELGVDGRTLQIGGDAALNRKSTRLNSSH